MFNHLNRFGLVVGIFIVKKKKGDNIFAFTLHILFLILTLQINFNTYVV